MAMQHDSNHLGSDDISFDREKDQEQDSNCKNSAKDASRLQNNDEIASMSGDSSEDMDIADQIASNLLKTLVEAFMKKEGREPNEKEIEDLLGELTEDRIAELMGQPTENDNNPDEVDDDSSLDDEDHDDESENEDESKSFDGAQNTDSLLYEKENHGNTSDEMSKRRDSELKRVERDLNEHEAVEKKRRLDGLEL